MGEMGGVTPDPLARWVSRCVGTLIGLVIFAVLGWYCEWVWTMNGEGIGFKLAVLFGGGVILGTIGVTAVGAGLVDT